MAGSRRSADSYSSPGLGRPPRPGRPRAGLLAGALAVAALALAGCATVIAPAAHTSGASGSAQPSATPGRPAPAARPLCASPAAVSQVAIGQTPYARAILPPHPGQPVRAAAPAAAPAASGGPATSGKSPIAVGPRPPVVHVVRSARRSRALARAVCDLPRFPSALVNCPVQLAGVYQLTFTADGRQLPVVTVTDTGCWTVTGAGPVRTAMGRPAFWALLTRLAGPAVRWPAHLPGAPNAPGLPNPGGPLCQPPSTPPPSTPTAAPRRSCPGPARPVATKLP